MTGEMSAGEVTEQNYPALFKLKDMLQKEGIFCDARPFDQYRGLPDRLIENSLMRLRTPPFVFSEFKIALRVNTFN